MKVTHRLAIEGGGSDTGLLREAFQTAQWAQSSEAAASLALMAARWANGDSELAVLIRERQDLVAEWQRRDGALTAAVSQAPERRNATTEAEISDRLTVIDTRIAAIDKRLIVEFPDYAALASPVPLPVANIQADLRSNEALLLFLDTPERKPTPEETFIWLVTKTGEPKWFRIDVGFKALTEKVATLRCGLDAEEWALVSGGALRRANRSRGQTR